jgi:hypothetical protein
MMQIKVEYEPVGHLSCSCLSTLKDLDRGDSRCKGVGMVEVSYSIEHYDFAPDIYQFDSRLNFWII